MVNEDVRMILKAICTRHGWSYAVFWRYHPHNPTMLMMEDASCEEHAESVVGNMLLQLHKIGEGIIGESALDGKHRWMHADAISWDVSEFGLQFSTGIKTIAVLPMELRGVLQLGSIHKISETRALVIEVKNCLQETPEAVSGGSVSVSMNSDLTAQYEGFVSMRSSQPSLRGDVPTSWVNAAENMESSALFDLSDVQLGPFADDTGDGELLNFDPVFGSLAQNIEDVSEDQFGAADFQPLSHGTFLMDGLTQWITDTLEEVDEVPSFVNGNDEFFNVREEDPACYLQSSVFTALNSCGYETNDAAFTEFGADMGWEKCVKHPLGFETGATLLECISEVKGLPVSTPRKGLFSELGLEHLLKHDKATISTSSNSCLDNHWPPSKKRKVEAYHTNNSRFQTTGLSWEAKLMQRPTCISAETRDFRSVPKSQEGLLVDVSCGMDDRSCISNVKSQSRKVEESSELAKKRARPGQSKKPKPKDRQQIAERINELRDLIPNGAKLSIDALLGRTIKHMDFLQNLTKHTDSIKQVHEPKLIGQDQELVPEIDSRGATWAFEVGGSNIVCPIIVEDLGHPCQMLIEMLCEEREYFLEMADIIKGFGLHILKGVMEERNNKLWAQFIVEAKKPVKRVDVFMSLMQMFQGPSKGKIAGRIEGEKHIKSVSALWGKYQEQPISI